MSMRLAPLVLALSLSAGLFAAPQTGGDKKKEPAKKSDSQTDPKKEKSKKNSGPDTTRPPK